jgi:ubiquinone/menaquinone biosynthesis C-methylase UbiE
MLDNLNEVSTAPLPRTAKPSDAVCIPEYLRRHYWWAYIHPKAVKFFDRPWLINLILLGNYVRLRQAALAEFEDLKAANVLQISCVYGDLTSRLARSVVAGKGKLDVIDVLPIQLKNLKWKLPTRATARLLHMDSTDLNLPSESYDRVLLFFLLHEQPKSQRVKTLSEALRVVKPGGKILIIDFARPYRWNPLFYIWRPLLALLEPFALDLWHGEITDWLPPAGAVAAVERKSFFGGFYQKVLVTRASR